jgi:hypothetical protein
MLGPVARPGEQHLGRRNPAVVDQILSFAPGGANDPNTIFRKQIAERTAANSVVLSYAGPIAGAKARAEFPYKVETGRPGSTLFVGGQPTYTVPTLQQVTNADGSKSFVYMQPPNPAGGGAPMVTSTGAASAIGPGTNAALTAQADAEQKQRQKVIDDANAAQQSQATLQNTQNEVGNFVQGPFSAHAQEAASYLRLSARSVGVIAQLQLQTDV